MGTGFTSLWEMFDTQLGDCIIQNGANSGVGQSVIQQARVMGVKTINIVRDRLESCLPHTH